MAGYYMDLPKELEKIGVFVKKALNPPDQKLKIKLGSHTFRIDMESDDDNENYFNIYHIYDGDEFRVNDDKVYFRNQEDAASRICFSIAQYMATNNIATRKAPDSAND